MGDYCETSAVAIRARTSSSSSHPFYLSPSVNGCTGAGQRRQMTQKEIISASRTDGGGCRAGLANRPTGSFFFLAPSVGRNPASPSSRTQQAGIRPAGGGGPGARNRTRYIKSIILRLRQRKNSSLNIYSFARLLKIQSNRNGHVLSDSTNLHSYLKAGYAL